ncbi:MAG TPA: dihydropteroate synthase [Gemmatimonadales bacterium]|nr:dihydropteroate synthase [Gemmatimonadales bacterium]
MIARALATHSPRAVRDALRARGWDEVKAEAAAGGWRGAAVELDGLDSSTILALVRYAGELGLDVLTGDDWAMVGGSSARLSSLARPWVVPSELSGVAEAVGLQLPAEAVAVWPTARGAISLDHPVIVGIINTTPDSFSDGGKFLSPDAAVLQADQLVAEGAGILDVGGESTRPGSEPVPVDEELRRVLPLVEALVKRHPAIPISVDTVKAEVAAAVLGAGAAIINDVSALRLDPAMARVVAQGKAGAILMHSRGTVSTMARLDHAEYAPDLLTAVRQELAQAMDTALKAGVAVERIVVDPGFGFAKTAEHNLLLLDQLETLASLGRPVLVGPSRKRFLGSVTGREVAERDVATAAACVLAYERGARLFRVHNVAIVRDALAVASAVRGP